MSEQAILTIREWGLRMRALAGAGPALAERTAQVMKTETDRAIREKRSPDGVAWAPRKTTTRGGRSRSDGAGPVLVNAAAAVTARGSGNVAMITLTGPEVFDHYGAGSKPRRGILPMGGVSKLGNAIRLGIVAMCSEFMTRSGRHDKGAGGQKWKPGGSP